MDNRMKVTLVASSVIILLVIYAAVANIIKNDSYNDGRKAGVQAVMDYMIEGAAPECKSMTIRDPKLSKEINYVDIECLSVE